MFYLLTSGLILVSTSEKLPPGCHLHTLKPKGYSRPGDILIGGTFPVHVQKVYPHNTFKDEPSSIICRKFGFLHYQWLQGMTFAIEEINSNPDILPNITLGFSIYDSCRVFQRTIEGTLWMLSGRKEVVANYRCQEKYPLAGIIGDSGSMPSILMAHILGRYNIAQISYFATNSILSDQSQFPSFFRTIPSDDFQSRGMAELVIRFDWKWLGLLAEDSEYGQQSAQRVKQEVFKAGVCIAFFETIILSRVDRNALHIVKVIKNTNATAIMVFCLDTDFAHILDEIVRQNITGKIWIACEAWSTSVLLSTKKYCNILKGTIGFAIHSGEMPGFEQYIINVHPSKYPEDIFAKRFWEETFSCNWPEQNIISGFDNSTTRICTGAEKLSSLSYIYESTNLRVTYNTYTAAYAIAMALHDMLCQKHRNYFHQKACADLKEFHPWQLLHYLKNVHFKTKAGALVHIDSSGNSRAQMDIINWQTKTNNTITHVKVGSYDSMTPAVETLSINTSAMQWVSGGTQIPSSLCSASCIPGYRKVISPGGQLCCFLCVPCSAGEISTQADSLECIKCPLKLWPNAKQDHCIPKTIDFLSYNEILGVTLATTGIVFTMIPYIILGLFIHCRNTPIVKANNSTLSYLLLVSLSLCFLCSLAFIGYPTSEKCLIRQAAFGITFALCISFILAKTITVVIAFNATQPNSNLRKWIGPKLSYMIINACTLIQVIQCIFWLIISPPFSDYNIQLQPGKITIVCNEGSPFAFWCMLGYLGLLATISFMVAFLARKLPDSFNDAQFITFSMLAFLSVWLSFIPAYLSTRGKYMVAMEIFAIQSSALTLLSCIFFPKCYIILVRPEVNTKEYLMGRGQVNKIQKHVTL